MTPQAARAVARLNRELAVRLELGSPTVIRVIAKTLAATIEGLDSPRLSAAKRTELLESLTTSLVLLHQLEEEIGDLHP